MCSKHKNGLQFKYEVYLIQSCGPELGWNGIQAITALTAVERKISVELDVKSFKNVCVGNEMPGELWDLLQNMSACLVRIFSYKTLYLRKEQTDNGNMETAINKQTKPNWKAAIGAPKRTLKSPDFYNNGYPLRVTSLIRWRLSCSNDFSYISDCR
jgi:hypothetical protein